MTRLRYGLSQLRDNDGVTLRRLPFVLAGGLTCCWLVYCGLALI